MQNALHPGEIVEGRYRIVRVLGEGGMGTVFLAEHVLIKRRVALKILHARYAEDTDIIERFMNEARAAGTLGHPNIVESTDMGFTRDDVPYIVFEYLEGSLLTEEIYRHPNGLPVRRALKIAEQIASALQAAHNAGIVHRDLKSDNVFLTFKDDVPDHVKVLDFGISQFQDAEASSRPQELMGTPEFMAPEQILHPDKVDRRADIWALGVILYELLTARRPFRRDNDPHAVLRSVIHDAPPPLVCAKAPAGLAEMIVEQLLVKDPDKRCASMKEVQAALESFLAPALVPLPPRPPRRTPWLAGALLAGAAGAATLAFAKPPAPPPPRVDDKPLVADVENDADMLARTLDSEAHAARLRASSIAQSPMLRAAIETDAATLHDVITNEMKVALAPGEVLVVSQMRGDRSEVLFQLPEGPPSLAVPPLGETRIDADDQGVRIVVDEPIAKQIGGAGGSIAISSPIDLADVKQRAATHAVDAMVTGLPHPVALAHASAPPNTQARPVNVTVAVPKSVKLAGLQLAAVIAIPLPPAVPPSDDNFAVVRYALWGVAGLSLVIYIGLLLRGRATR